MASAPRYYHYCCDKHVNDTGWGCVYRSMQNALAAVGWPVPTLEDLMRAAGTQRAYRAGERVMGLWTEPAPLAAGALLYALAPRPALSVLFDASSSGDGKASSRGVVRCGGGGGRAAQYTHVVTSIEALLESIAKLQALAPTVALVLDDVVFGYCVVLRADAPDSVLWLDPHTHDDASVATTLTRKAWENKLRARSLWMVVAFTSS